MLLIEERCPTQPTSDAVLALPFHLRQKTRLRTRLVGGEEVGLFLERGTILRGGDCLRARDGRIVRVEAAPERVLRIGCADVHALVRVAYHLGNRHVELEIGAGFVRIADDPVLADLARRLGAEVVEEMHAFEPEAGAYASGHSHGRGGHESVPDPTDRPT